MSSNQSPEIIVEKNRNLLKCMNLYHLGAVHFLSSWDLTGGGGAGGEEGGSHEKKMALKGGKKKH